MKKVLLSVIITIMGCVTAGARDPEQGYRGFADFSLSPFHQNLYGLSWNELHYGISTVHGYQINRMLFVGAGLELGHNIDLDSSYIPVFADVRADFRFGRFTPFADMRVGWTLSDDGGFRLQPMVGYRYNWGRRVGINVGVGFTLQSYKYVDIDDIGWVTPMPDGSYQQYSYDTKHKSVMGFTVRVGIDF